MKRGLTLIIGGIVALTAGAAFSQCVSDYYPVNSAGSIGISAGTGWQTPPPIAGAISVWSGGCSSGYGSSFPTLNANSAGDINITVSWISGPSVDIRFAEFAAQLNSNNQVTGGVIKLYSHNSSGTPFPSGYNLEKVIAHEIGHVLGIGNTPCLNHIMGPNWNTVGVNPEECDWVNGRWTTPAETGGSAGGGSRQPSENCPLILDLNGDGIHTTSVLSPVRFFDPEYDGIPNEGGWTNPKTEEAFVWIDVNANEEVDLGELLGSGMILPDGVHAYNGFQVLQFYDRPENGGNQDGEISRADGIFHKLRLWVDRNHDGQSNPDDNFADGSEGDDQAEDREETSSLAGAKILSIGTSFEHVHAPDGKGNMLMLTGSYTRKQGKQILRLRADDIGFRVLNQ